MSITSLDSTTRYSRTDSKALLKHNECMTIIDMRPEGLSNVEARSTQTAYRSGHFVVA